MATRVDLDQEDQVQKFLQAMGIEPTSRSRNGNTTPERAHTPDQADDAAGKDSPTSDDLKASSRDSDMMTPNGNRSRVGSDATQVTPSPHLAGLLAPQNTPQTMPHSPRHLSISNGIPEEPNDLGAVFRITSSFPGKPLNESRWAKPSNISSDRKTPSPSERLISTKVAKLDDSTYESYERMSFKAADPELKGASIVGDRVPINPITKDVFSNAPVNKRDTSHTASSTLQSEDLGSGQQWQKTGPVGHKPQSPQQTSQQIPESSMLDERVSQSEGSGLDSVSPTQRQVSLPIRTKKSQSVGYSDEEKTVADKDMSQETSERFDDHKSVSEQSLAGQATTTVTGNLTEGDKMPPHLKSRKTVKNEPMAKSPNKAQEEFADDSTNIAASVKDQGSSTGEAASNTSPNKKSPAPSSSSDFLARWLSAGKNPSPALGEMRQEKENTKTVTSLVPNPPKTREVLRSKSPNVTPKENKGPDYPSSSIGASVPKQAVSDKADEADNLEHKLFFNQWPKLEERDRAAAQIRTVIISELPSSATASFVASLVFGGPIEYIHVVASSTTSSLVTASVRFLHAADCASFYDATSNGLVYSDKSSQGTEKFALVHLGKDVDVIGGLLGQWIQAGVTRCVRAVPVEAEYGREYLWEMAEQKTRKLEGIDDSRNEKTGARYVIWRFCDIKYAVEFKAALARDEEWEVCNVSYADDPCARAADVRT